LLIFVVHCSSGLEASLKELSLLYALIAAAAVVAEHDLHATFTGTVSPFSNFQGDRQSDLDQAICVGVELRRLGPETQALIQKGLPAAGQTNEKLI
jgi:hypothetical protein